MHHDALEVTAQKGEGISVLMEWIMPHCLLFHPRQAVISGEEQGHNLTEDLRTSGWTQPLVTVQQDVIISVHQHQNTALVLKWPAVPVEREKAARQQKELAGIHPSANLQRNCAEGQRKQGQMEGFHER
jgi:hypothetical protein